MLTRVSISVSADIAHIGKTDISLSEYITIDTYRPICISISQFKVIGYDISISVIGEIPPICQH